MASLGYLLSPLAALTTIDGPVQNHQVDMQEFDSPFANVLEETPEVDLFGDLTILDETAMSAASGGNGVDFIADIGNVGVNLSTSNGSVDETTVINSDTGAIANNVIADNRGITTVINNTGNGVVMQSTVNVNVFMDGAQVN